MQSVERKQHREGKPRRWILLAAALVLLAGSVAAAVLLSRKPEEIPKEESHWGMLIDRQAEELVSVTVQQRGKEPWTLVRTVNGNLMPENDEGWTVAEQQDALLQESVTQLRYEEILTEDPAVYRDDPESFGLAEPLITVTARYTDGTETVLHIGSDTGLEDGWHYMTAEGDDRLYAVSSAVAEDLDVEYAVLRPVPKPEIYAALLDTITVTDGEKTVCEWQLQGQITDRDAESNWAVTVPFRYPADGEAIQNLKKSAENLRLGVYTAPATAENLQRYGLDNPQRILVFHMAAGSTGTVGETGVYDVQDHEESTVTFSKPCAVRRRDLYGEHFYAVRVHGSRSDEHRRALSGPDTAGFPGKPDGGGKRDSAGIHPGGKGKDGRRGRTNPGMPAGRPRNPVGVL